MGGAHGFWNNSDTDVEIIPIDAAKEKGVVAHTVLDLELCGAVEFSNIGIHTSNLRLSLS